VAECLPPRASLGILPDDLYIEPAPWPRIGRPPKHDLSAWTVTDDWPKHVPIIDDELDVFEASCGDLFDLRLARLSARLGGFLNQAISVTEGNAQFDSFSGA
jgi:hypothetical protein